MLNTTTKNRAGAVSWFRDYMLATAEMVRRLPEVYDLDRLALTQALLNEVVSSMRSDSRKGERYGLTQSETNLILNTLMEASELVWERFIVVLLFRLYYRGAGAIQ